jgi:hypothetical protein
VQPAFPLAFDPELSANAWPDFVGNFVEIEPPFFFERRWLALVDLAVGSAYGDLALHWSGRHGNGHGRRRGRGLNCRHRSLDRRLLGGGLVW